MVAVCDERQAREPPASTQPHLRGDLVSDEADQPCCRERPQIGQLLGVDQPLDRLVERYEGADQNCGNNRESCDFLAAERAQEECDPERDRGQSVAEIVNQIGKQCDAASDREDRRLNERSAEKDRERDRDGLDALTRANDRGVDESVRVTVATVTESIVVRMVVIVRVVMIGIMCVRTRAQSLTTSPKFTARPNRRC